MPESPASAPQQQGSDRIDPRVWRIAIVVILGAIMSILDTTIVNIALDTLSRDLHAGLDQIQWVVTGYMLALAAVIPITGWAAKRFGARQVYLLSLVLFTAGSALCGFAWSSGSLIGFRVLQGLGGGMLMPIGMIVLVKASGPRNLGKVMSVIGVPIILAPVFGPTIGGLLLEHIGWQWIFFVNLPIGAVAVAAALRLLPHDRGEEDAGRLDLIGLVLVAAGMVGITYGLAETGTAHSFVAPSVIVPIVAGLALVAAFVVRELRIENPLLDVRLYSNRAFSAASVTTAALGAALFGAMVIMPLYFQIVRGEDAVLTGILLAPQGVGAAIAMALSGRAADRYGGGIVALVGGIVSLVATLPFVLIGADTSYWLISGAMVARGFGIGMTMMPAMTAAYAVLTRAQVNDATPQLNTLQRVGGSIGTAILTVTLQGYLIDAGGPRATASAMASSFATTFWWVFGITAIALIPTLVLVRAERRVRRGGGGEAPEGAERPADGASAEPAQQVPA